MESKQYVVIARKYRPLHFDEVIGQDHIVTTLKNTISLNRIGHAYLFTGPRGVGKTSMARIFAKALNCKNGPTVDPCGKCQVCLEIDGSRSLDVLEIDGASNRGIDEIRALRENVKFAPALGKYKIYIIDEVHQITPDGFNALLKTLEEPPAHVKFIFATTASHKVPATILSRCQRFDFRRIPASVIVETLKEICKKEKIKINDEALFLIAKAGDGSFRDSQSILDQIAACSDEKVSEEDVIKSLGSPEEENLLGITEALAKQDAKSALLILDQVLKEGKDPLLFMERLLEHTRNLLFVNVSDSLLELIDSPESYKKALLKQKPLFSKNDLFYFFSVISHALSTMKRFEMKRIPLEMALVKLAHRTPTEDISKLLEKFDGFEKKNFEEPRRSVISNSSKEPVVKSSKLVEIEPDPIEELPEEVILPKEKPGSVDAVWEALLRALRSEKMSVASYLAEGEPRGFEKGVVKISFPEKFIFHREFLETGENTKLIERHLSSLLDQGVRIEFESVKVLSGRVFKESASLETRGAPEKADPASQEIIKSAMNLFGGKIV